MISSDVQGFSAGDLVELFIIDLTFIGGDIYYFTKSTQNNAKIEFDGNVYEPIPIEVRGFEKSGQGALPRPQMRVPNVNAFFTSLNITFDNLIGATVKRIRTFAKYLDNGTAPDPSEILGMDVFKIDRKVSQNKVFVEFELASVLDQQDVLLPKRQILKNTCLRSYRYWDETLSQFVYTNIECPYAGSTYFDATDTQTLDPSKDQCSKTLQGCSLRFGANAELPIWAFPGIQNL